MDETASVFSRGVGTQKRLPHITKIRGYLLGGIVDTPASRGEERKDIWRAEDFRDMKGRDANDNNHTTSTAPSTSNIHLTRPTQARTPHLSPPPSSTLALNVILCMTTHSSWTATISLCAASVTGQFSARRFSLSVSIFVAPTIVDVINSRV